MVQEVARRDDYQLQAAQEAVHCPIFELPTTKSREQLHEDHPPERWGIDEGISRAVQLGYSAMAHVSQESILSAIQEGLRPSQFLHKISRKMPKTYVVLKIKAFSHASADEYIKGKKGEPSGQKKETKRKEQDTAKDAHEKKSRPKNNQVLGSAPKPFTSSFNSYTPLNTSRE